MLREPRVFRSRYRARGRLRSLTMAGGGPVPVYSPEATGTASTPLSRPLP